MLPFSKRPAQPDEFLISSGEYEVLGQPVYIPPAPRPYSALPSLASSEDDLTRPFIRPSTQMPVGPLPGAGRRASVRQMPQAYPMSVQQQLASTHVAPSPYTFVPQHQYAYVPQGPSSVAPVSMNSAMNADASQTIPPVSHHWAGENTQSKQTNTASRKASASWGVGLVIGGAMLGILVVMGAHLRGGVPASSGTSLAAAQMVAPQNIPAAQPQVVAAPVMPDVASTPVVAATLVPTTPATMSGTKSTVIPQLVAQPATKTDPPAPRHHVVVASHAPPAAPAPVVKAAPVVKVAAAAPVVKASAPAAPAAKASAKDDGSAEQVYKQSQQVLSDTL